MTPDPRCVCGKPVKVTIRRRYPWGDGPFEHVCRDCAPPRRECAVKQSFWKSGRKAEKKRAADVARAESRRAAA